MKKFLFVGLLLITLLLFRFYIYYQNISNYTNGQKVSFHAMLFTEPQVVGTAQRVQRFTVTGQGGERIFVTIPRYPQFHYADTVRIVGAIKHQVLTNEKIIATMQFPKIEAVKKDKNVVLAVTSFVRQKVILLFEKTLSSTSSSLLLGIVFGIKQNLPKEFNDSLRVTGVLHVIAASGMNVTLVGGFLSSFFMLFFKRQVALVCSILGIAFYAFLAGLEPSILRASLMGGIVFTSQILGRQNLPVYALALAGFGMLFVSPPLLEDIGFQLSFLATLGILYIKQVIEKPLVHSLVLNTSFVKSDVTTTLSAQIATLPILLSNFGQYSLISILVNGLLLWTIPTIMILGGIGAVAGMVFEPIGKLFLYLCLPFLWYFEKVVVFFAGLTEPIVIEEFPLSLVVGYYCILLSVILFLRKRL